MCYILHKPIGDIKLKLEYNNKNYKSMRVRHETYKEIKRLALNMDIPITKLIELMFSEFKKSHE